MGKPFNKKIAWVIKNFSSLKSDQFYSDKFVVDGCIFMPIPWGKDNDHLSLFLEVGNYESLPIGGRRHAKYSFTISNQSSEKLSRKHESQQWFEKKSPGWGRLSIMPLNELHAKDAGFLVNGDLKIVVEIDVLEVVGRLDVTEETSTIIETMDVNGFQILPSHAESVSRMFERHSELASEFRPKNPNLRTAYISFLLSLIETMCQSPQELSQDDLTDAYAAMGFMRDAGFKLDWLEKKLDEVSEKKKNEKSSEAGLQEMEEDLRDLKRKCSDMEDLVKKEKIFIAAAEIQHWFEVKSNSWGFPSMLSLHEINSKDGGFLVNGELKIAIEIDLLEIIGKVEVCGFHLLSSQVLFVSVLPLIYKYSTLYFCFHSQVDYVSRMFEKHPETASEVHLKNPNIRTGYMNLLLSLIDTLHQSPHELPKDDLDEAHYALESLTDAGFKLDWLEKKISQVSEMKEKAKDGEIRRQEIETELKDLKQKCSDVEAQLEKEKSKALATKTRISFDNIIE
ncbi:unnamed protein product [Brassica oleracea]